MAEYSAAMVNEAIFFFLQKSDFVIFLFVF